MTSYLVGAFRLGLLLFAQLAILHLGVGLARADTSADSGDVLVCSGSMPVGKIHSGSYYPIWGNSSMATGSCTCETSTGALVCSPVPKFPIGRPQGQVICQAPGATSCAGSDAVLCAAGKPIGGLNSKGGVYLTVKPDEASGYCQCGEVAPWNLRCPDYPTSQSWSQYMNQPILCSKGPDCQGLA